MYVFGLHHKIEVIGETMPIALEQKLVSNASDIPWDFPWDNPWDIP